MTSADKSKDVIPTVSRVSDDGSIVELLYDPAAKTTALVVADAEGAITTASATTTHTGDRLVPYRRRWKLSQRELAELLGIKVQSTFSRVENGERYPRLREALACELLFGVPLRVLFPVQYQTVEEAVMQRAAVLSVKLEGRTSPASAIKRKFLQALLLRASSSADA